MAKTKTPKPPALTPEETTIAHDEVTAYYDERIRWDDERIAKAERELAEARASRAAVDVARTRWVEHGEITDPSRIPQEGERWRRIMLTEVSQSSAGRWSKLARVVIDAIHGSPPQPVPAGAHEAAEEADLRRKILDRWLAQEHGFDAEKRELR